MACAVSEEKFRECRWFRPRIRPKEFDDLRHDADGRFEHSAFPGLDGFQMNAYSSRGPTLTEAQIKPALAHVLTEKARQSGIVVNGFPIA